MRFLVAPDSFKGTLSAREVAEAIGRGLTAGGAEVDLRPAADGGEGTVEALLAAWGGELRSAPAHDPLGREIEAGFALLDEPGAERGAAAAVEVAAASGLGLVAEGERDAEAADSSGTGELIAAAVSVPLKESGTARNLIGRLTALEVPAGSQVQLLAPGSLWLLDRQG